MASRSLHSTRHLFVSPSGSQLPRWLQAFPTAKVVRPGGISKPPGARTIVWLRLDPGEAITPQAQLTELRKAVGAAPVIVLANEPDQEEALALFSAGARAYCNTHATAANLRQVAEVVQAGGLWIGEALMARLLAATRVALARIPAATALRDRGNGISEDRLALLTSREQEVARAVAGGSSNKEVARQLGITERTVKAHVGAVFQKLKARDRLHLALIINGQRPT